MTEHGPQGGDELNRIEPGKAACWTWCWTATLPATASSISASRNRVRERTGA